MNLQEIVANATQKSNFTDLKAYLTFCTTYLSYIADNLQATIVSQNENNYRFYQYNEEGGFQITRPINANLMYNAANFASASTEFLRILGSIKEVDKQDNEVRKLINNSTYTIQQYIGAALDALPTGRSNTARKLNGDLFE